MGLFLSDFHIIVFRRVWIESQLFLERLIMAFYGKPWSPANVRLRSLPVATGRKQLEAYRLARIVLLPSDAQK